jgi:hypothetical protein
VIADNDMEDPNLQDSLSPVQRGGGRAPILPPKLAVVGSGKGKEMSDDAPFDMKGDPRPKNTGVWRCQSSTQTKMLEVTESQGRDLVLSMQRIGEVEDRKVAAVGEMAAA